MQKKQFVLVSALAAAFMLHFVQPSSACAEEAADGLQVSTGDSIVIIGNTFADHLRLHGYFETILHARYPEERLRVRNLGWSGDTVNQQLRPASFGDLHVHLARQQADTIFVCLGMMESYRGGDAADQFQAQLSQYVAAITSHQYNGESSPQVVLVSPIAHENVGGGLPTGEAHNPDLEAYTAAMKQVADDCDLLLVDLFTPTYDWYRQEGAPQLTTDGIHLNQQGYAVVSQMLAQQLGLLPADKPIRSDTELSEAGRQLREAVVEKNYQFYMRWRALNGEYIYGRRRAQWKLAQELLRQDEIVEQAEQRIWALPAVAVDELWAR